MIQILFAATLETIYMVLLSSIFSIGLGLVVGIFLTQKKGFSKIVSLLVDIFRSLPFAILMILTLPLSRLILHTSIGTTAAVIPLTCAAIPFYARIVESSLNRVHKGVIEAAKVLGASPKQILCKVLLPESFPSLISGAGLMMINLVGYSAMAGLVGGGGLGKVAIQYGYYRYDFGVLFFSSLILILLVGSIQWVFQKISSSFCSQRGL